MRVDLGDYVMLRPAAVDTLLDQGYDVRGLVAEVVDGRTVPDGYDLTLKFEGIKTLITQVPVRFVQHVAVS
jgi:hypothetical protein